MTVKESLLLLYDLQQLDSALDALLKQYAALDKGQGEQERFDAAKAAHSLADAELKAVQATIRDTELEQKGIDAKKQEEETKLYSGKVRAAKELQALQDEIDGLDRRRAGLDEKMLTLMEGLETRRKRAAETKTGMSAAKTALRVKVEAFNKDTDTLRAQAMELQKQRNAAAAGVPESLLHRYEKMRKLKQGIAIVSIVDGNTCGGCRMGLPSSVVGMVHEGNAIILCDNCERMLADKR